jgi:hypothetical protein
MEFPNGPHRSPHGLEKAPAFTCCQSDEQIGQGDVGPEPRQQVVTAIAPGPIATWAFDAHDVQWELAERS